MTKEKYVVMSIDDTGHGISGEHLPMIFDPFFTTKQKGSGLGLATAYSIVNKHDGFITVDSQLGRGTTFRVYLPATEKEILRENRRRPGALPTARGKILIMDDEDDIRAAVGTFMRSVGYEVEFVKDGAAAVEMYGNAQEAGEPYGAVILDLTIPGGMGGGETIERLKMINPQVRAIVSSGYSEDLIVSKYKDYGFKDSLPKPYSAQELIEVLNRVLNTGESC